ncbi:MAG: 2-isopropylmalate synthase, partial [Rhodobacterales bacterium]
IMAISRRVAQVSGFAVQFNKAIVGKNAFAHESGIHQDGMLKNPENFEIMRPEDIGLAGTSLPLGKHSGRELADSKKEVFDADLIALMTDGTDSVNDRIQVKFLRVICGTEAPQSADLTLEIDGKDHQVTAQGDGPVDATFNAVKKLVPHEARLQLYQVHAVTEGTDAQATVSVRMEENGKIVTGQSSDTDTVVASAKAYVNALNNLLVRRKKTKPEGV